MVELKGFLGDGLLAEPVVQIASEDDVPEEDDVRNPHV